MVAVRRRSALRVKLPGSCWGCLGFRWVIVSSSDEVLWMVDVSIVLSRIRHSQASQVGSFRQILARILRSDGSVLAWIINI